MPQKKDEDEQQKITDLVSWYSSLTERNKFSIELSGFSRQEMTIVAHLRYSELFDEFGNETTHLTQRSYNTNNEWEKIFSTIFFS